METLAALLNQDQIADYFGISRTTFFAHDPAARSRGRRTV